MQDDSRTLSTLRRLLAALFVLTSLGAAGELLLVEHTEDLWQLLPLLLLATSLPLLGWIGFRARPSSNPNSSSSPRPRRPRPPAAALRGFQALMLLFLASAAAGFYLHYRANAEFELEMYPDLAGWPLFWKAIQGASPPSLAPGAMAVLGLLGLAWTYRHPALTRTANPSPRSKESSS